MKVSDLIQELQQWLDEHGDLEITDLEGDSPGIELAIINDKPKFHIY